MEIPAPAIPRVNRKTWLVLILAAALAVRLAHLWFISQTAFPKITLYFTNSDMYATWQWARTIVAGDLLGRETYHPYFIWMREVAPLETWFRWWGGKETFEQAPLYAYFVAALAAVSRGSMIFIFLCQLLLGVAQVWLMFLLGRRLLGEKVGLIAAGLTALYGPFVFYQATLLRDWLPPILEPAALLLMLRARERGRSADWALAGVAVGAAVLTRESAVLLLPVALLWMTREKAPVLTPGAALLAGLLVALAPLVARNAAVGAPLLTFSNRAAETLISGNAAEASGVGLNTYAIGKYMQATEGRLSGIAAAMVQSYEGEPSRALHKYFSKLRAVLGPADIPDNLSYDYGETISPALRLFTVSFAWLVPFALVGAIVARRETLLLALYALSTLTALLILPVVGRYRLALAPAVILYAAAGLAWLYEAWRKKNPRLIEWLFAVGAAAVFELVFVSPPLPVKLTGLHGGNEYIVSARIYADERRFDRAIAELDKLEAAVKEDPDAESLMGNIIAARGQTYRRWADWLEANGGAEEAARMRRKSLAPAPGRE